MGSLLSIDPSKDDPDDVGIHFGLYVGATPVIKEDEKGVADRQKVARAAV